jgi:hypothetical protein
MSFELHGAQDELSWLHPLGIVDMPDFELLVIEVFELPEVSSAGLEIDGRKLHFLP